MLPTTAVSDRSCPSQFWNYRDEDFMGAIKRMAATSRFPATIEKHPRNRKPELVPPGVSPPRNKTQNYALPRMTHLVDLGGSRGQVLEVSPLGHTGTPNIREILVDIFPKCLLGGHCEPRAKANPLQEQILCLLCRRRRQGQQATSFYHNFSFL
jgi:hypothetical protein